MEHLSDVQFKDIDFLARRAHISFQMLKHSAAERSTITSQDDFKQLKPPKRTLSVSSFALTKAKPAQHRKLLRGCINLTEETIWPTAEPAKAEESRSMLEEIGRLLSVGGVPERLETDKLSEEEIFNRREEAGERNNKYREKVTSRNFAPRYDRTVTALATAAPESINFNKLLKYNKKEAGHHRAASFDLMLHEAIRDYGTLSDGMVYIKPENTSKATKDM